MKNIMQFLFLCFFIFCSIKNSTILIESRDLFFVFNQIDHLKYSIMIATHYPRIRSFKKQLNLIAYGQAKNLSKIYICWADLNHPFPGLNFFGINSSKKHIPVEFFQASRPYITERFIIPNSLSTNTMLIMDDDNNIPGQAIDNAFNSYISNYTNSIYGFARRRFLGGKYTLPSCTQPYSMVLTSFSFLNKNFLYEFNKIKYQPLINMCSTVYNCDDILMNFIVSHAFKVPPQGMKIQTRSEYAQGVSSKKNHLPNRHRCYNYFNQFFGYDVLESNVNTPKDNSLC